MNFSDFLRIIDSNATNTLPRLECKVPIVVASEVHEADNDETFDGPPHQNFGLLKYDKFLMDEANGSPNWCRSGDQIASAARSCRTESVQQSRLNIVKNSRRKRKNATVINGQTSHTSTSSSQLSPPPIPWPLQIDNSRLEKMQMLSDFLEMHLPTLQSRHRSAYRKSYLIELPGVDLSSDPMIHNAVQAICYAHAGLKQTDDRLIQLSQISYGKVLGALVQILQTPKAQNEPAMIISSIMLLSLYDDSTPTQDQRSSGWQTHYWGVHDYIKAYGPSCFDMESSFQKLLFMNLKVPMLFLGLSRRRAIVLSQTEWAAFSNSGPPSISSLRTLLRRVIHLPGLLEQADELVTNECPSDFPGQIAADLLQLRDEIDFWSVNESSFAGETTKTHDLVIVSHLSMFDMSIEEHVVISTNETLVEHFRYRSYRVAEDTTLYHMFCLIIDTTLLRLLSFVPVTGEHIEPRTLEGIQQSATAAALHLCKSVYFMSTFNSQGVSGYLDTLVALAESYFGELPSPGEFGWCQAIRCATKLRIARLRQSQSRSLCRMGDLADDLSAATKFRSLPTKRKG